MQTKSRAPNAAAQPSTLTSFDSLPDSAFVGSAVVRNIYGVTGDATLWKWWKAGRIPSPRKLAGSRRNSWNVGELRRALAIREADHAAA